jgi:ribosomal protein L37AE/L43A
MKPLRVDTKLLQILAKDLWNTGCEHCKKPRAKWEMQGIPICSLCFLYESQWGRVRAAELGSYLGEVMAQAEEKITAATPRRRMVLGPSGQLTSSDDADFILGILVVTSRRFDAEDLALTKAE